jgi:hypothetical protein
VKRGNVYRKSDEDRQGHVTVGKHTTTQKPKAYIRNSMITQSEEEVNMSAPRQEQTHNTYKGKNVIKVGKQDLVQMDNEGNAFVGVNVHRAQRSTKEGQRTSGQQPQRSGQWMGGQISNQVDRTSYGDGSYNHDIRGQQKGHNWTVQKSGQQRANFTSSTGPQNQGDVNSDFSGHHANQERNQLGGQSYTGTTSGYNNNGKMRIGQIQVHQTTVNGGSTYGNNLQAQKHSISQQNANRQVGGWNADRQQSEASRFTSQQHQIGAEPREANFPALVQKDGRWEVRRVSVDDNQSFGTQTPMEVQRPLERKVTLGAKDQNAPQRRELMKEFKQRRSFEDVKEDGTHGKHTTYTSGGTAYNRPSGQVQTRKTHEPKTRR